MGCKAVYAFSTGDSILARPLQRNQTKEPLTCPEPTSSPWEEVATDIFTLDDKNYLCTVDYYSGFFEVDQLHSKTGTVIIKKLKRHFVTHGTPNELLSGNEPPFNSAEFENFLQSSGTEHVTSYPGYLQCLLLLASVTETWFRSMLDSISWRVDTK